MTKTQAAWLMLFLVVALALLGAAELAKGGLLINKHEGDTLHLFDIVGRMVRGQRIHQDFMTPIGVLAFAPIVAFARAGMALGHAMIAAQLAVAVLLLPAIWFVVSTRLTGWVAWLAGLYLVVLTVALTYGEADASLSMSMHYNRWAWVLAYLAILPALLAPVRPVPAWIDGAIIGLAMAALVLLKATYFIAFLVPVTLSLMLRGAWRVLGVAALAGLAVALVATLWGGFGFWRFYIGDLAFVAISPLRVQPGQPLSNLMGAPAFLGVNLVLLFGVVLLRQARASREGLILLTLFPGFLYVTFQNFGNDSQWLVLLIAVLIALRPGPSVINGWGWPLREAFALTAVAALAFALPSYLSLIYSPYRHLWQDAAEFTAMIPDNPLYADVALPRTRFARVDGTVPLDADGSGLERYAGAAKRGDDALEVNGLPVRACDLAEGLNAWFLTMARDLEAAGYSGSAIYEADLFNLLWLFGDFRPLQGGAPWYYGGTPGLTAADLVLVPACAVSPPSRKAKVAAIAKAGVTLTEVRRTPLYTLYTKSAP